MSELHIAGPPPPDVDWTLDARPIADGVAITGNLPAKDGAGIRFELHLDRADARTFALAILAAAGDAMARTFPRPHVEEA